MTLPRAWLPTYTAAVHMLPPSPSASRFPSRTSKVEEDQVDYRRSLQPLCPFHEKGYTWPQIHTWEFQKILLKMRILFDNSFRQLAFSVSL